MARTRRGRRLAAALALVLAGLAAASAGGLAWLASRGRAQREGRATLPGLSADVRVRWDRWAVPRVEASSAEDLAAAVGFLHAGDRMVQMELARRAAAGRLSELLGWATFALDVRFRRLGLAEAARAHAGALGDESRAWLEAYARGVNAWLEQRGGDLPPELVALGCEPEPWTPEDSLGIGLLLVHDLSLVAWRMDAHRFAWLRGLGRERAEDLAGEPLELDPELAELVAASGPDAGSADEPPVGRSNNWAVSGARAAGGAPLVANDPHLNLQLPSTWYQVVLRAPDLSVAGVTLPGLPCVLIGRNEHLAWAVTNTALDDHDLLIERFDAGGERVQRGEAWIDVRTERVVVPVRGRDLIEVDLAWSDLGPILPFDTALGLPRRTLHWAALAPNDPLAPFLGLARAADAGEVAAAARAMVAPCQNLVVGTDGGEIVLELLGRVPDRPRGTGRLPLPGWKVSVAWSRLRAEPPALRRPEDGILATANDDVRADPAQDLPAEFDVPHRARRIRQALAQRDDWTAEGLARLQSDVVSLYALEVVALCAGDWSGDAATAHEALRAWDGAMALSGPSALYALLERELEQRIFADELEAAGLPRLGSHTARSALLRVLGGTARADWYDDARSDRRETREDVLAAALASAWRAGADRWGPDVARWRYGELHTWTLEHPLGEVPVVGRLLNRGPFPVPGSRTTIAAWFGSWRGDAIPVVAGPSLRFVADVAEPDRSRWVLPGGQSGHPLDEHYDDQLELFLAGDSIPIPWSEEAAAAATVSELVLAPP